MVYRDGMPKSTQTTREDIEVNINIQSPIHPYIISQYREVQLQPYNLKHWQLSNSGGIGKTRNETKWSEMEAVPTIIASSQRVSDRPNKRTSGVTSQQ